MVIFRDVYMIHKTIELRVTIGKMYKHFIMTKLQHYHGSGDKLFSSTEVIIFLSTSINVKRVY